MRELLHSKLKRLFIAKLLPAALLVCVLPIESAQADRTDGFRVAVLGGITSNATATLVKNDLPDILESSDESSAAFGAIFCYGLGRFDLGVSVEHMGSGSFQGFSGNRRLGGKARIGSVLNWHFVAEPWGSMFFGLSPGVVFIQHNDQLRAEIATNLGRQPNQLDGIDRYNTGFSFSTNFGLSFRVNDTISVMLDGQIVVNDVPLQEESDDLQYLSTQSVLRIGFAAQL